MRLLLDTHTFLWFVGDDPKLSATARLMIGDGDNEVMLSLASIWEIAIKVSIGKLLLAEPLESFVTTQIERNDIHYRESRGKGRQALLRFAMHSVHGHCCRAVRPPPTRPRVS